MAGIKCIDCLKVFETICGINKHLSTYKGTMHCIILCQTQHQVLIIPKAEAIVPLTKQMLGQIQVTYFDREERPTNKIGSIYAIGNDNAEMADEIVHESLRSTIFWSRSGIQSTQNVFKLIKFNDGSEKAKQEN